MLAGVQQVRDIMAAPAMAEVCSGETRPGSAIRDGAGDAARRASDRHDNLPPGRHL